MKDIPSAQQVAENLSGLGYSGYAVVETIIIDSVMGGRYSDVGEVLLADLYVDIYKKPWSYWETVHLYYYNQEVNGKFEGFTLSVDALETSYDADFAAEATMDDIQWENDLDKEYYGASPTPGVPWKDPYSENWYLDGELYEGGLYGM